VRDPERSVRLAAIRALGAIGAVAHGAIPALVAILHDQDAEVKHPVPSPRLVKIGETSRRPRPDQGLAG